MSKGRKIAFFIFIGGIAAAIVMFIIGITSVASSYIESYDNIVTGLSVSTSGSGKHYDICLTLGNPTSDNYTGCTIRVEKRTADGQKIIYYESEPFSVAASNSYTLDFGFDCDNMSNVFLVFNNNGVDTILEDLGNFVTFGFLMMGAIVVGIVSFIGLIVVLVRKRRPQHNYSYGGYGGYSGNYSGAGGYNCNPQQPGIPPQAESFSEYNARPAPQTLPQGYCKFCGAPYSHTSAFCTGCGAKIEK